MKELLLKKKKLLVLQTLDEFEDFLEKLDQSWESKSNSKKSAFNEWVNHYYEHLLKDLGPSNGSLFS